MSRDLIISLLSIGAVTTTLVVLHRRLSSVEKTTEDLSKRVDKAWDELMEREGTSEVHVRTL